MAGFNFIPRQGNKILNLGLKYGLDYNFGQNNPTKQQIVQSQYPAYSNPYSMVGVQGTGNTDNTTPEKKQNNNVNWSGILEGTLGTIGSWIGAYANVPKSDTNDAYMPAVQQYGNNQYYASTPYDLVTQWNDSEAPAALTAKDLYDPSQEEMFASMFGAGIGGYNAIDTNWLNGKLQSPRKENNSANNNMIDQSLFNQGPNSDQYSDLNSKTTNIHFLDDPKNFQWLEDYYGDKQLEPIYNTIYSMWNKPENKNNDNYMYYIPNSLKPKFISQDEENYSQGGHLCADGAQLTNWGNFLGTGMKLLSGFGSIWANAAGIKAQQRKAEMEANEYNANRLYAQQLNQHNFNNAVRDTKNNMFNQYALQMMAEGGPLFTQGLEFPMEGDFRVINEGNTHEANPNGGVPQGLASDGQPNLVEEGEVIWNDYVFSDSRRKDKKHNTPDLKIPQELLDTYKELRPNMTFAEAAKKLSKEAEERPNDYISQNGLEVFMSELRNAQETVKQEQQAAEFKKQLGKMSPQELMQLQAMLSQGSQQPQQQQISPEMMAQGMFAFGGHLFDNGGDENETRYRERYLQNFAGENQERAYRILLQYLNPTGYSSIGNTSSTDDLRLLSEALMGYSVPQMQEAFQKSLILNKLEGDPAYTKIKEKIEGKTIDDLIGMVSDYQNSLIQGKSPGYYAVDPSIDAAAIENDPEYRNFNTGIWQLATKGQLPEGEQYNFLQGVTQEKALEYLQKLDARNWTKGSSRPTGGNEDLFQYDESGKIKIGEDGKPLFTDNAEKIWNNLKYDKKGGVYHLFDMLRRGYRVHERIIYKDRNGNIVEYDPNNPNPFYRATRQNDDPLKIETDKDNIVNRYITHNYVLDPMNPEVPEIPELPEDTPVPILNEIPRYAPILGSAAGALQSLVEEPKDYSTATQMNKAGYQPIGNYLEYNPVDTQRYLNAISQQQAAQNAAIMNASGSNKNMAMANMLFSNRASQQNMADILNQAEAMNFTRRAQVGEFNRGTDQYNATAYNEKEGRKLAENSIRYEQDRNNALMRYQVDAALDAARGENLTNFFNNLGALGQENLAYNMANSNKAIDYMSGTNPAHKGISSYKGKKKAQGGLLTKTYRRR